MKYHSKLLAAFSAVVITASAFAAAMSSPAGNWKWTSQGRNGPQEATAKFEVKDSTLTGSVTTPRGDTPISQGTFKDGNIAFVTELAFGENKFVIKYTGKLEGDTIKGTIERPGFNGGDATKVDWTASRVK
jgi:opacity protein-like surface antigen